MNRAKDNGKAKAAPGDVRTACKGLNAGRKADNKAGGNAAPAVVKAAVNAGRKAEGNAAPAVVRAAERLEIQSFWLLIRTTMANCRPPKSPTQPHH